MTEFRIPVGIFLCCLLCCSLCCSNATAQYTQPQPNPPRKQSAMEKLSQLNKKLKNNLKHSLFGPDEVPASQQNYQTQRGGYNQPPQYSRGGSASQRQRQMPPQQRASQAQYQQEIPNDWQASDPNLNPNGYRQPANERFDTHESYGATQNMAPPNPMRSSQGQHYGANSNMGYAPAPRQMPATAPPAPRHATSPATQFGKTIAIGKSTLDDGREQKAQIATARENSAAQRNRSHHQHSPNGTSERESNQQNTERPNRKVGSRKSATDASFESTAERNSKKIGRRVNAGDDQQVRLSLSQLRIES